MYNKISVFQFISYFQLLRLSLPTPLRPPTEHEQNIVTKFRKRNDNKKLMLMTRAYTRTKFSTTRNKICAYF